MFAIKEKPVRSRRSDAKLAWFDARGLALAAAALSVGPAPAADPNPAMSRPDQVAWESMAQIARPAGSDNVVFETWASDADTFVDKPRWPDAVRKVLINRVQPANSNSRARFHRRGTARPVALRGASARILATGRPSTS